MPKQILISAIQVEGLFGVFNYSLQLGGRPARPSDRVAIIYGDNGSGKTTLLKILYHLLSPVMHGGHRSFIHKTKFNSFAVGFSDGSRICAKRSRGRFIGGYELQYTPEGKNPIQTEYIDSSGPGEKSYRELAMFLAEVSKLDLELIFVRDNRLVTSSRDVNEAALDEPISPGPESEFEMRRRRGLVSHKARVHGESLKESMDLVTNHFRQIGWGANAKGELDSNNVITSVINSIVRTPAKILTAEKGGTEEYLRKLGELSGANRQLAALNLTSPFAFEPMIDAVRHASPDKHNTLITVLQPFVEALQVKLSALKNVQHQIERFVGAVNSFLYRKRIRFDLGSGLKIEGEDGAILPEWLSSGERQLLLLFCRIVLIKEHSCVFLIDEPEISLNVKWQRILIEKVLECTEGSPVQFILASHSVELMAQYPDRVAAVREN